MSDKKPEGLKEGIVPQMAPKKPKGDDRGYVPPPVPIQPPTKPPKEKK